MGSKLSMVLSLVVIASFAEAGETVPADALDRIGEIVAIGGFFKPLCPCGRGLELTDEAGHTVKVALGPGWDELRSGFRLGAIAAGDSASIAVAKGSVVEQRLLDLMWGYLDRNYSYWEQRRLEDTAARPRHLSERDAGAAYLLEFLREFQDQEAVQRWLDHRLSREAQERIYGSDYATLETEFERQVFELVCKARGGSAFVMHRSEHREIGGYYSEIESGSCQ